MRLRRDSSSARNIALPSTPITVPIGISYGAMTTRPIRSQASAIKAPAQAVAHVRRMVDEQAIYSTSGKRIPCQVDSICVHGDNPTAVVTARLLGERLAAEGVALAAFARAA